MFGKLYHTMAIASTAIVLAAGAQLGLLCGTGKLTAERVEAIAAILRQHPNEPADGANADTADTGEAAAEPGATVTATAGILQQQQDAQLQRALDERAACDHIAQRRLLEQALQHLVMAEERFERDKKQWEAQLKRRRGATRDEGFAKELSIIAGLSPKLAKEHIIRKWKESPADAVRVLNALPESKSRRILGQMKTPEEMQITHELLERLSKDDAEQFEP
ncbi:MAG: hypothetical protein KKI02_05665 [Planctomycetes bacterium]|nr:hypothetical protein [Planctomycetota bacterium]